MTREEKIERLMAAHYRLMAKPRYWYEERWQKASAKLCILASDLRAELRQEQSQPKFTTLIHLCVSIRGVLRWSDRELAGMFRNDDGSKATGKQVREYLLDQLQLGRKVLPTTSECEGFSYETGCPGHRKECAA